MSVEFITPETGPAVSTAGPSTGSWATHHTGDEEGAFPNMDVDADLNRVSCVESMCMGCHKDGITRMLLTKIPYFREIVVMSFACPHCHARSAEVQPANDLGAKACRVTMSVPGPADPEQTKIDLNRQVIKSETGRVELPALEFEIPANNKRGDINTVEGVLSNIGDSLEVDQPNRELADPEVAAKIQNIIDRVRAYAAGEEAFTFVIDDLGGNSFLENPFAPARDADRVDAAYYERTRDQTLELGYQVEELKSELEARPVITGEAARKKLMELFPTGVPAVAGGAAGLPTGPQDRSKGVSVAPASMASIDTYFNVSDRSAVMTGPCTACDNQEAETRLCVTDVPHFKDVVLLVTQCEECGYRDAEVKPIGVVSEKGRRITLRVTNIADLSRDLLKSDTASCEIPELDLELLPGTLGGKYTTLEGLLEDITAQLSRANPFSMGDSSQPEQKGKMGNFLAKLAALPDCEHPWTFILDCPLGNVFIHSPLGESDPNLTVERYERTYEQNEELGLNDINTEHYLDEEDQNEFDQAMKENKIKEEAAKAEALLHAPAPATDAENDASRKIDLKKSKIGGLISVDHEADQEGATGSVGTKKPEEGESASAPAPKL